MESFMLIGPEGTIECLVHPSKNKQALLLMAHGFRGSREGGGRAAALAEHLSTLVTVVRFNFHGSQILSRQVGELRAVLQKLRQRYPQQKLFLLGRSLGGAASIIASEQESLAGLILWSTPNNLRATFRQALGEEQYQRLNQGQVLSLEDERGKLDLLPQFLSDFDQYNLGKLLARRSCPLLLLHGAEDEVVLVEQARKNFAMAAEPKELRIYPGADHSLGACQPAVEENIRQWLKAHLPSGK